MCFLGLACSRPITWSGLDFLVGESTAGWFCKGLEVRQDVYFDLRPMQFSNNRDSLRW